MTNQGESPTTHPENIQNMCQGSGFGYWAAGLGIGAALGIFLAPKAGQQTREWLEDKCLDAVDTANEKVRKSRTHLRESMDRGQEQISRAVAARRHTAVKSNGTASEHGATRH